VRIKDLLEKEVEYTYTHKESQDDIVRSLSSRSIQSSVFSSEKIQSLLKDTAYEGDTSKRIVVIEYTDLECPFCIRSYNQVQLRKNLQDTYRDEVGVIYKNNK
jgi:protein-disulfide isomerase